MEADGLEQIETGDGEADAGDYYVAGKVFDTNTTPNSKRYNETATGVSVNSISGSGNLMSFVMEIPNRAVDFDMEGRTDIAVYRPSNGWWIIVPSSGASPYAVAWGATGDIPVPGDYDGDGRTDIAVYRPSNGWWIIIPSSGASPYAVTWGASSDIPPSSNMALTY
jgi:hypothetical protein